MHDPDDFDPESDMPRVREMKIEGNTVLATMTDPFGFWVISLKQGPVPDILKGHWTSAERAMDAANQYYIVEKDRAPKNLPPRPEIKYKPGYPRPEA